MLLERTVSVFDTQFLMFLAACRCDYLVSASLHETFGISFAEVRAAGNTPEALAVALTALEHAQINPVKQNSDRIARPMSAEHNQQILREVAASVPENR
jgi:hypothetical protein